MIDPAARRPRRNDMSRPRSVAMTVLGVWAVAYGIQAILPLVVPGFPLIVGVLALVAGILILMGR
jgi:hypothetical protein